MRIPLFAMKAARIRPSELNASRCTGVGPEELSAALRSRISRPSSVESIWTNPLAPPQTNRLPSGENTSEDTEAS
jgi:hypothetical protein